MVSIVSLGTVTLPFSVQSNTNFAFGVTKDYILANVMRYTGGVEPPAVIVRINVDRTTTPATLSATTIYDFNTNACQNFLLYEVEKQIKLSGYGIIGGICGSTTGLINDPENPASKYLCLCDDPTVNCNLTSNISKCYYDQVSNNVICGGADGSRVIWIISPDLSTAKKLTHSEALIRGRLDILPYGRDELLVAVSGGASGTTKLVIGKVSIDDILNAVDGASIDSLPSYVEMYRSTTYNYRYRYILRGDGVHAFIKISSPNNALIILYPDGSLSSPITSSTLGHLDPVAILSDRTIAVTERTGGTVKIHSIDPATQSITENLASYSSSIQATHVVPGFFHIYNVDNSDTIEIGAVANTDGTVPVVVSSADRSTISIYDYLTWTEIANAKMRVIYHRLLQPQPYWHLFSPAGASYKDVTVPYTRGTDSPLTGYENYIPIIS